MKFSVCVGHNSETICTTDLELQGYVFMSPPLNRGVDRFACDIPSVSLSVRLRKVCVKVELWGHLCPMDTCLSFIYSDVFPVRLLCGMGALVFVTENSPLVSSFFSQDR